MEPITRLLPTTKPSAAFEGHRVALSRALQAEESVGAIVGTLVHRWFEEIAWLDDFDLDREALRAVGLATLEPEQMALIDMDFWLQEFERWLGATSIQTALSRSRYAAWQADGIDRMEVSNERKLLELLDQSLLRGTIDRLVLGYRKGVVVRAEILDYKTDALDPKVPKSVWQEGRLHHHRPQLELYRRVICQQFSIAPDNVAMALILLSTNALVPIAMEND